jgi:hypothetical protein
MWLLMCPGFSGFLFSTLNLHGGPRKVFMIM